MEDSIDTAGDRFHFGGQLMAKFQDLLIDENLSINRILDDFRSGPGA